MNDKLLSNVSETAAVEVVTGLVTEEMRSRLALAVGRAIDKLSARAMPAIVNEELRRQVAVFVKNYFDSVSDDMVAQIRAEISARWTSEVAPVVAVELKRAVASVAKVLSRTEFP